MSTAKGAGAPFVKMKEPPMPVTPNPEAGESDPAGEAGLVGGGAGGGGGSGSSATTSQAGAGVFVAGRDLNTNATLGIGTHQYVILVPEDPSKFESMGDYAPRDLGDGTMGIVIGAHNVEVNGQDTLRAIPFEEADVEATREYYDPDSVGWFSSDFDTEAHPVNLEPSGKSIDETITEVITATENYNSNDPVPYGFPGGGEDARNSNSWAQSVIEETAGAGNVVEDFWGSDIYHDRRIDGGQFEEPTESD